MSTRSLPFAIPDTTGIADPSTRRALEMIRANLNVAFGISGTRGQRLMSVDDATAAKLVGFDDNDRMYSVANRKSTSGASASVASSERWRWVYGALDARLGIATGVHTISGDASSMATGGYVVKAYYMVATAPASATSAATISLGVATDSAAGIKAATIITDPTWGTGPQDGIPDWSAANVIGPLTGDRDLIATVAVEALTDGLVYVAAHYFSVEV